jgi:hypothetical protein
MTGPDPIPIAGRGIGAREDERVSAIVEEGRSAGGDTVESFEAAFAEFCAVGEAVATSSGTVALHAALQALGIGEGDRVVTSPLTFATTASAIRLRGAEPVFADVDMETFNLDPHAVRSTVRAHAGDVDAIVAAHLHGLPAAMGELRAIADECGAVLVEDAARAHGARYHGRPVGSLGDVACFSFAPRGDTTAGDGGAVVTDDEAIAARCRQFVDGDGDDRTARLGRDFGMTNVAAAIRADPAIREEIVVVWLGGHPHGWHTAEEFNLMQDVHATRTLLGSGVPLVQVPCKNVAEHLTTSVPELRARLGGRSELADYLVEAFADYKEKDGWWSKEVWDLAAVACVADPSLVRSHLAPAPHLGDDLRWSADPDRHLIRVVRELDRDGVFAAMGRAA